MQPLAMRVKLFCWEGLICRRYGDAIYLFIAPCDKNILHVMDTITVRDLRPEEYSKCIDIWGVANESKIPGSFYGEFMSGNRVIFVATRGEEFLAEGALVFDKNDPDYTLAGKRVYLSRIGVKASCRRQGLGQLITQHLISHAKELGYREFSIGVNCDNTPALRLYEKLGFTETIFQGSDEYGEYLKLLKRV